MRYCGLNVVEKLEMRRLLSASYRLSSRGTLLYFGTDDSEQVDIYQTSGRVWIADASNQEISFDAEQVKRIYADLGDGDDWIRIARTRKSATLIGGAGDDRLDSRGRGNDVLEGRSGNDTLLGGDGTDALNGGSGRDVLNGQGGNDALFGQNDNDTLLGDAGNDNLNGGDGNDRLLGQDGNDTLNGNTGDDHLNGGAGANTLAGNAGNDWADYYDDEGSRFDISSNESSDNEPEGFTIEREGVGSDYLLPEEILRVITTQQRDRIGFSLVGFARIEMAGGNDSIGGGAFYSDASITVLGGNGNDIFHNSEGGGLDQIFGGPGDDTLVSESKLGFADAGSGFDTEDFTYQSAPMGGTYTLGKNVERFMGDPSERLTINGNELDNTIYVRRIGQTVFGGEGNDEIIVDGPDFNDSPELAIELHGGKGNDTIHGAANAEKLFGDEGDDTLIGAAGADTLDGGEGEDSADDDPADVVSGVEKRDQI